jgi:poly(A) polymerase
VEAGPLLDPLNELTLADCTTRNQKKVRILEDRMAELKGRIVELREREEFEAIRPELDGTEVMEILGIPPSPEVGLAMKFLLQLRLDEGLIGREQATQRLLEFWAKHRAGAGSEGDTGPVVS